MAITRCLSVRQPFAWAIVANVKHTENRTWSTDYRGTIAIHASTSNQAINAYRKETGNPFFNLDTFPLGAIIGLADIVDVALYGRPHEQDGSAFGPVCWTMANGRFLSKPIPLKGKLNLFSLPEDVVQQIDELETFEMDTTSGQIQSAISAMFVEPDPISSYVALYDEFQPRGLHSETLLNAANRMIELDPYRPEGHAIRASLLFDPDAPALVLTDLLRAIELDPEYLLPLNLLGMVHLDTEQYTEAIAVAERAIEIDNRAVFPYWLLARAHRLLGNLEQSVANSLLAIGCDEKYVDAYCELAEAYAEQGKKAESIAVLDKALVLVPGDTEILTYKAKLENPAA